MEKKPKKDIGTAKERRHKFGKAVDMDYYYKCQGKTRPIYMPSSGKSKKKKIICSVCKKQVRNATLRDCWYCEDCLKYSRTKNIERRKLGLFQNPNKLDFDRLYENKKWLQLKILNLKKLLIKKSFLISRAWESIQQAVLAGVKRLQPRKK